jgi:hypothetical protein
VDQGPNRGIALAGNFLGILKSELGLAAFIEFHPQG